MPWRVYSEWALAEVTDAIKSTVGRPSPYDVDTTVIKQEEVEASQIQEGETSPTTATTETPQTELTKAQIRRAQVRRAQIQHRQRKANRIKQLELDVSQMRDMISLAQREAVALRRENGDIKLRLAEAGIISPVWNLPHQIQHHHASSDLSSPEEVTFSETAFSASPPPMPPYPITHPGQNQQLYQPQQQPQHLPMAMETDELFRDINVDDLTVTLSVDKNIGSPCFHISSNASRTSGLGSTSGLSNSSQRQLGEGPQLSLEQEHMAINFILSLEHICWSHFGLGDFHHHEKETTKEKGHTLMASAYCMSSAPESVYADRRAFYNPLRKPPTLQWGASGLTLDALHGLASSLNPGDLEVAPVQAWFELASRYPSESLLQPHVLDSLAREFTGTVKCVIFGAAVEKQAFESIVNRVLGPPVIPMTDEGDL